MLTSPDRPAGRGRQPLPARGEGPGAGAGPARSCSPRPWTHAFLDTVRALRPRPAGGRRLRQDLPPASFLDLFPRGGLNVHPSLLPRFRGPSPIPAAILAGDPETGVSVQRLALRWTPGRCWRWNGGRWTGRRPPPPSPPSWPYGGPRCWPPWWRGWSRGTCAGAPQAEQEATYCRLVTKEDGRVDWNRPAERIGRMIRAYDPWPRAWTLFQGQTLALLEGEPAPGAVPSAAPAEGGKPGDAGRVLGIDKRYGILIQTGEGPLGVRRLQLQARKPMDWAPFLNGHHDFIGALLGG